MFLTEKSRFQVGALLLLLFLFVLVVSLLGNRPVVAAPQPATENNPISWNDHCYDCIATFSGISGFGAAFDSNNVAHIVYGDDALYHSMQTDSGWTQEIVDPALGGNQAMLAIDAQDQLHVAYVTHEPDTRVQYAVGTVGQWTVQPLPPAESAGALVLRIALDDNGQPLIALRQGANVYLLRYDGQQWSSEFVVDSYGNLALAVTSAGEPIITFEANQDISLFAFSGGSWIVTDSFTRTSPHGTHLDFVIDSQDRRHLLFSDQGAPQYVYQDGNGWQQEAIAIDYGADAPHVYYAAFNLRLVVAADGTVSLTSQAALDVPVAGGDYISFEYLDLWTRQNGVWSLVTRLVAKSPTLILNQQDEIAMFYTNGAWNYGPVTQISAWHDDVASAVVSGGVRGTTHQLERGENGAIHIISGSSPAQATHGRWFAPERRSTPTELVLNGHYNSGSRLALQNGTNPVYVFRASYSCYHCWSEMHIGFYDNGWQANPIAYDYSVAFDLVVADDGTAYVLAGMFYDGGTDDDVQLLTVNHPYPDWFGAQTETVAQDSVAGSYSGGRLRLGMDSGARLHGLYTTYPEGALVHVWQTASGWEREVIVATDITYPDLVVDNNDVLHVAYCDAASGMAYYAQRGANGWQTEALAAVGESCFITLAVDIDGTVHVLFYAAESDTLQYAVRDGGWSISPLPTSGDPHPEASLALDTLGYPVIAYHEQTRGDLRLLTVDYARQDTFMPLGATE